MLGRERLDAWLTRRGVLGNAARDRVLAVVLAVLTAAGAALLLAVVAAAGDPVVEVGGGAGVVAVLALQCLVLAVRRSHPRACLWVVAALQAVVVALVPVDVALRGPATVVAAYTVGTLLAGRAAAHVVALAVLVEALGAVAVGVARGEVVAALLAALGAAVTHTVAALVGSHVGTRRRYAALLRERAVEAEAAQEARVRAAVEGERTRMARELHDIAAHHLSGMVVQAAAVQRLVHRDPDAAREGVASIRAQGRRTLEDLRLLVGVLRDPDGVEAEGAPVPGLARLEELVADARAASSDVALAVTGEERPLAPLADVTCYRLVQEALSNARQHAPGAAVQVRVEHTTHEVVVEVLNGPSTGPRSDHGERAPAGVGLTGMRERAQLVGATLSVGPTDEGGWQVRAVVPRTEEGS